MKKLLKTLFFTSFALFNMAIADVGPVAKSTSLDNLGQLQPGSLEQFFIYVKNVNGATLAQGSGVVLDYSEDDGYSVNTSVDQAARPHCMIVESCADDALCKCQTYGYTSLALYDNGGGDAVSGGYMFASTANAGYFVYKESGTFGTSHNAWGVFYDSSSSSGAVEAFIDLR